MPLTIDQNKILFLLESKTRNDSRASKLFLNNLEAEDVNHQLNSYAQKILPQFEKANSDPRFGNNLSELMQLLQNTRSTNDSSAQARFQNIANALSHLVSGQNPLTDINPIQTNPEPEDINPKLKVWTILNISKCILEENQVHNFDLKADQVNPSDTPIAQKWKHILFYFFFSVVCILILDGLRHLFT